MIIASSEISVTIAQKMCLLLPFSLSGYIVCIAKSFYYKISVYNSLDRFCSLSLRDNLLHSENCWSLLLQYMLSI